MWKDYLTLGRLDELHCHGAVHFFGITITLGPGKEVWEILIQSHQLLLELVLISPLPEQSTVAHSTCCFSCAPLLKKGPVHI
jgi:hypothetical protein